MKRKSDSPPPQPSQEEVIAQFMADQVTRNEWGLDQPALALLIKDEFGEEFVYDNDGGNMAINKKVLAKFRKLTKEDVIWDGGLKVWRKRSDYDLPGRRQG